MLDRCIPAWIPSFDVSSNAGLFRKRQKNKPALPVEGDQGAFDMFETSFESRRIATAILLGLSLFVAACGGSSDGTAPPDQATGTVALLLTDLPTDDVKEINFDVVEATLIGDEGQQTVYSGNTRVNLLDLKNFS
jgi:hypothetical protein